MSNTRSQKNQPNSLRKSSCPFPVLGAEGFEAGIEPDAARFNTGFRAPNPALGLEPAFLGTKAPVAFGAGADFFAGAPSSDSSSVWPSKTTGSERNSNFPAS